MWGMTAMKKGTAMKDKKKRAGGGGSPPPGPSFVFRIAPLSTIGTATGQSGWSHSGFDFYILDDSVSPPVIATSNSGIALGVGPQGGPFTMIPMDDAAATTLASSPSALIHSTTAQTAAFELQAGNDYTFEYEVSISPGANHGTVRQVEYTTSVVHDPNNLVANGTIRFASGQLPHTSTVRNIQSSVFRDSQGFRLSQTSPTEVIFEITGRVVYTNKQTPPHNMTTETASNLTGGSASATESMYIRLIFA